MQVLTTVAAMRHASRSLRFGPPVRTLGLVPTMGALHAGHISLVRAARQQCDSVAVTLFVNPLQFGPNEDFERYPRTFDQDCALLQAEGVDLLFAPTPQEMYPAGAQTFVDVPETGARLDGASRPGHFRGVATVVSKLFHIAEPDRAFFGQKDAAQVAVLRAMVRDLNFGLELVVCPIIREPDGLALSSRNRYLSPTERQHALALSRALRAVEQAATTSSQPAVEKSAAAGEPSVAALRDLLHRTLATPGIRLDYAELVHPDTLLPVADLRAGALVAVAAWVGSTRLIDNTLLPPQPK